MNETDTSSKIGRHMLILAWAIALGLLGLLFSNILDQQHNPNQTVSTQLSAQGHRQVTLQRNRQGHYVSDGTINGMPVTFLLDTGATVVSIPEHTARELGLQRGAVSYAKTANGTIKTYRTRLKSVGIGDIKLENVAAQINPYFQGNEILLGMSFLKRLELSQRGDSLVIQQATNIRD